MKGGVTKLLGRTFKDLLWYQIPVCCPDARLRWNRVAELARRCRFIPPLQFMTIRCDESQHDAGVHAAYENPLIALPCRHHRQRVGVGLAADLSHTVQKHPDFDPLKAAALVALRTHIDAFEVGSPQSG